MKLHIVISFVYSSFFSRKESFKKKKELNKRKRSNTHIFMRLLKQNSLLGLVNSYVVDSPQPANLSYAWNFGSLLATCLGIQIVTGIILAMHYTPNVDLAFVSVEHIMRDVNYGWMIRYIHANVASFFFIFVYLHIGRGLYYGSYKSPRVLPWSIGVIILVLMMGIAFLGYVLPYGQMSLWGATVITNMLSAIPWIGQDFVQFVWGGFSVNNATLNRFFSLHYLLPFVLAALAIMHLMTLHVHGSSNPLGVSSNADKLPMHPYYLFKDLVTIFLFFLVLALFVFYMPNALGHSDNYIPANPMQTPPSIVPEWYLLPYYAILRSIPNKLLGVVGMLGSLLILLAMPILDTSRVRGSQFRPLMRFAFWVFVTDFFLLMYLGSQHAEEPYITVGAIATAVYFGWFIVVVPVVGIVENTLMDIATSSKAGTEVSQDRTA
jgi:ubiquinol-cytochrome c reductase cytochrome b subunit